MNSQSILFIIISTTILLAGCAAGDDESGDMAGFNSDTESDGYWGVYPGMAGSSAPDQSVGTGFNMDGGIANPGTNTVSPLPPEEERKLDFKQPQAGERYIFAANPDHNSIAVIDAKESTVQKVEPSKEQPLYLQAVTVDGEDIAVVLNVGRKMDSPTYATVIRQKVEGSSRPRHTNVKVVRGSNAIAISPSGRNAVIYYDPDYESANNVTGSYQDITVISLVGEEARGVNMTVGFRPSGVYFSESGAKGFVVTEDGVSILDFEEIDEKGSDIAETVPLGYSLHQIPSDVSVTPDGRYALARLENASEVHLVDLETREYQSLDLVEEEEEVEEDASVGEDEGDSGVDPLGTYTVTDLDLAPSEDGEGMFSVAVIRDKHMVKKIPIPEGFEDPTKVSSKELPEVVIGLAEISPDGKRAILYTNAIEEERVTVLNLDDMSEPASTYSLHKTIDTVIVSPDSEHALVIHKKQSGNKDEAGLDPDEKIDRSYGFSLCRLSDGFVKLETTETEPKTFVATPEGHIFILFRDDALGIKEVLRVSLKNYMIDPILLSRPPISIGVVPKSRRVFINQEQSDGLITLIDWESNEIEKVEGFDRASNVTEQRSDVSE